MQNLTRDDSGSLEKLEREHNDYVSRVDDPPVLSEAAEKRLIRKIDYKVRVCFSFVAFVAVTVDAKGRAPLTLTHPSAAGPLPLGECFGLGSQLAHPLSHNLARKTVRLTMLSVPASLLAVIPRPRQHLASSARWTRKGSRSQGQPIPDCAACILCKCSPPVSDAVVLAATGDGQATVGAVRWYGLSVLMRHDLQVGYVVTEIPSNIALKHLKPSRFIPAVMLIWVRYSLVHPPTSSCYAITSLTVFTLQGIIMTLMGLCTSFGGLVAARFCLGLAESPLFPGICYYLVSWYKRDECESDGIYCAERRIDRVGSTPFAFSFFPF